MTSADTWYVTSRKPPSWETRVDAYGAAQMEFAQCHIDWARRNQASWEEAKAEVQNIQPNVEE
jgi:hypothetical protein